MCAEWVLSKSDFTVDDLSAIRRIDDEGPNKLVQFGTQLGPTVRLDFLTQYPVPKVLLFEVFDALHVENGQGLTAYKANSGYNPQTAVMLPTFAHGRFAFQWDPNTNLLVGCTDKDASVAQLPQIPIDKNNCALLKNELDDTCSVQIPGLPAMNVKEWFAQAWGPNRWPFDAPRYRGKVKTWQDRVTAIDTSRQQRIAAAGDGGVAAQVQQQFQQAYVAKHQVAMAKARAQAQNALNANRLRMTQLIGGSG